MTLLAQMTVTARSTAATSLRTASPRWSRPVVVAPWSPA